MELQTISAATAAPPLLTQADVQLAFTSKPDEAKRAIFDFNKQALASAMRSLGLTSVAVTYSGSGDSGQIDEVGFQPADLDDGLHRATVAVVRYRWDEERSCGGSELLFEEMLLCDIAEALCDTAIELCHHDGYENNDGGSGTFTLQAGDASVELEHSYYYTESDTSVHAL